MFNSAGEIEKLEQYFAELFRRLGHGAATATGEKFFRMWEEACNPLPFIVPKEGLRIGETVLIQPEKDKDAKRVACLSWDAEGQCPSLLVETAEKSVIQRLGFKDGAIVFGESIEIDAAMPEESEGEKVEVMSEVAKIIKRDYPQIDLKTVKKEYIKKALIELQETQPSKTAKKLIRRTGLYKELMAKVLSEMAEDERDAQLAFTFDNDPPSSVAAAVNPEGALEGVLPVRGDWEVKRDLDLLCETENRQLHCEETFELSFEGAKVIVPCHDGMEVVQLPLPTDLSIPLREGSRLELYPAGMPKATIGYFTVDVLDESTFIGTIGWSENEYQVDGELRGKPRKSPQGYVTRVVNMMRDTTQDRAMTGQLALRGMLGIMPLPYFYPAEETTADFPMLDSQQARAVRACLDPGHAERGCSRAGAARNGQDVRFGASRPRTGQKASADSRDGAVQHGRGQHLPPLVRSAAVAPFRLKGVHAQRCGGTMLVRRREPFQPFCLEDEKDAMRNPRGNAHRHFAVADFGVSHRGRRAVRRHRVR